MLSNDLADIAFTVTLSSRDLTTTPSQSAKFPARRVQAAVAEKVGAIVQYLNQTTSVTRLKTSSFSMNRDLEWNFTTNQQVFKGWRVSQSMSFRVTSIPDSGTILDRLTDLGATSIDSISFVPSEEEVEQAKLDALREAGKTAIAKAEATLMGLGLGRVCVRAPCDYYRIVQVEVEGARVAPPPAQQFAPMPMMMDGGISKAAASTVVMGGEASISAYLTLKIEYF